MTDYELFIQFLTQAKVGYTKTDFHGITIELGDTGDDEENKNHSYGGFMGYFTFNDKGKLIQYGFYE